MRKICIMLLVLFAAMTITGCGNNQSSDGITIVKMSLKNSTNENDGWFAMIDAANVLLEKENIRIEKDIIMTDSWDDYYITVNANFNGRVGGTIGRIAESHIPNMIKKRQLQDLTSVYNQLDMSLYNQEAFDSVAKVDGKYYGLPTGVQHMVLYYNKRIFDEYNKNNPNDPIAYPSSDWNNHSTFEEIKEIAIKLSNGQAQNRNFGLSAGPFLSYAGMYALSCGGYNIYDNEGNSAVDSDAFRTVYKWFDDMLTANAMPKPADTQIETSMDKFLLGKVAMNIDGAWWLKDVLDNETFEVGIAAVPVGTEGSRGYTTSFTDCFFALSTSKHPEADKKAIQALMSVEAITAVASTGVGGIPVHKDALEAFSSSLDVLVKDGSTLYKDCFLAGASYSVHVPYSTYYNSVDQEINQNMSQWLNGKMSYVDFVKYMDERLKYHMSK